MYLSIGNYTNRRLAIECETKSGELYSDVTINLPELLINDVGKAFIDSTAKYTGLEQALIDNGIIERITLKDVSYNMGHYDLALFSLEKLEEYDPIGYKEFMKQADKSLIELHEICKSFAIQDDDLRSPKI